MRTIWVAELQDNTPGLAKVLVDGETDKTFHVHSHEAIMGWVYVSGRVNKEKAAWFDTATTALEWLVEKQQKRIEQLNEGVLRGEETLKVLRETLVKVKEQDYGKGE